MKINQNFFLNLSTVFSHLSYIPILALAALIGLLRMGVYARILGVDGFGSLSKLFLVSSFFGVVGSLGFHLLVQRDLPAMFAKGMYREGIIALGKTSLITTGTAVLASLVAITGFKPLGISPMFFVLAILHGWSQQIYLLAVTNIRSRLEMSKYSIQILVRTIVASTFAVIIARLGGGEFGVIVAEVVVNTFLMTKIFYDLLKCVNIKISDFYKISLQKFSISEWSISITLLLGTTLAFFSTSVDRWLAAHELNSVNFGIYSFAWISISAALSIQALLNAGLFPLISNKRISGSKGEALRLTATISIGLLVFSLVVAYFANLIASWVIPIWYVKYLDAVPLILPLLIAAAFRVSDFWFSYLVIAHKQNSLLKIQIGLFAVLILVAWYEVRNGLVPSGYSFAMISLVLAIGNYIINAIAAYRSKE